MNIEKIEFAWNKAYQAFPLSRMTDEMDEFLNSPALSPFHNSQHWVYLSSQVIRLKREREELPLYFPQELPGMVYGMLSNAWYLLLKEIKDANDTDPNRIGNITRERP